MTHAIVAERNFVLATRDTGYRSTASAVSELVDNAIQAGARSIQIRIDQEGIATNRQLTLSVLDDGRGMRPTVLRTALQFGGTERFGDRSGQGRFGMGLPNSSVSQCRRVEVYSWQQHDYVFCSYLDVDEIASGSLSQVPEPQRSDLPAHITSQPSASGTAVVWLRCDRLDNRKASTIASKLFAPLGRTFRYFLWGGGIITVNGERVVPIDPLFCRPDAVLHGATEHLEPLVYEIRVPNNSRRSSRVRVRFSLLPIQEWHTWPVEMKRRYGIVGGAGVSVIRAGREIDYGWLLLGRKRKQNYDDWWRCEVTFEPDLDELFGVTHSKQEVNPTPEIQCIISPDLEVVANILSTKVRTEFARLQAIPGNLATQRAEERDWRLPPISDTRANGVELGGTCSFSESSLGRLKYRIIVERHAEPEFFTSRLECGTLVVVVNEEHPFFQYTYGPACRGELRSVRDHLDYLLLAAARAELQTDSRAERKSHNQKRVEWSNTLAAFWGA